MPTVTENLQFWSDYDWKLEGNEWNIGYGGTRSAWQFAILPRIQRFIPADHILELAPGHGVWTEYLRPFARRMTLVDLTPRCIEFCRRKYGEENMTYIVNDGRTIPCVDDGTVDFVFSWHSLVHAEHDVMRAYVQEINRVLRPGGMGLIHHTNYGEFAVDRDGRPPVPNDHWRGIDMTARKFRDDCAACGLQCVYQELVPWGSLEPVDCFSLVQRPRPGQHLRPTVVDENPFFWQHIRLGMTVDLRYREQPQPLPQF